MREEGREVVIEARWIADSYVINKESFMFLNTSEIGIRLH